MLPKDKSSLLLPPPPVRGKARDKPLLCLRPRAGRGEEQFRASVCERRSPAEDGWMAAVETAETNPDRFAHVLGLAALDLWSERPRELQQTLFERAVVLGHQTERDESLREQLAQFLHAHHERTAGR
jgi:hypothetical protein